MVKGKRYSIKWIDTFGENGWYDEEDLKKRSKEMDIYMESVGFFVGEYYGFVVVSAIRNKMKDYREWGHPEWIPRGCIKKITLLK